MKKPSSHFLNGRKIPLTALLLVVVLVFVVTAIPITTESVSGSLFSSRKAASISLTVSTYDPQVGKSVQLSGLLQGIYPLKNAKIDLKVELPDGTVSYPIEGSATYTSRSGTFNISYIPDISGEHKFIATYRSGQSTVISNKSVLIHAVEPEETNKLVLTSKTISSVSLSLVSTSITVGEGIHATGILTAGTGIPGAVVNIKIIQPDGTSASPFQGSQVVTDSEGKFELDYTPAMAGAFIYLVIYEGNDTLAACSTSTSFMICDIVMTPTVIPTALTLSGTGTVQTGSAERITGTLRAITDVVIPYASLSITLTGPDGNIMAPSLVTTNANGEFSYSIVPSSAGNYYVSVAFGGDASYLASSSTINFIASDPVINVAGNYDYIVSSNLVKDAFGATVYSSSDLATALKWATSQPGKTIYVPAGIYTITGLDDKCIKPFADGVTLYGDGSDKTIFRFVWTGSFQDHRNTDTYRWSFGLRVEDHSGVTIKQLGVTGDGSVAFRTNFGTTSNNKVEDVMVFDTSHHNMGAFGVFVADGAIANDYRFYRCTAYNSGGDGFDLMGHSTTTSGGFINRPYFEECKALYSGYSNHRWNWAVGYDLREKCQVKDPTLLRCEASYSWESGFHFEYEDISLGTVTITDCVASYNGQKYSQALGAYWGFGLLSGHYYGEYPNDGSHYIVTGLTGVGNVGGLEGSKGRYADGESDSVVGFTYMILSSSPTKVYSSDGSTVAYTGSSATDALQWAVSHDNAVVWVRYGTYILTGSVLVHRGVCLIGDLPTWDTVPSATYLSFPTSGSSGLLIQDSSVRLYNLGIKYGNVQITALSSIVSDIQLKGVSFYQTTATRGVALYLNAASGATISNLILGNVHATSSFVNGLMTSGTVSSARQTLCSGLET